MLNGTDNPAENDGSLASRNDSSRWPMLVALGVGIITAILSIRLESSLSSSFGDAGFVVTVLVFPGILGSIAIGQNSHAFSLWMAAGINLTFYFIFVWIICDVSRRIVRRFR